MSSGVTINLEEVLLEALAKLEHEQWMKWSKELVRKEALSPERIERWMKYWIPYEELPEDVKEHDRKWARKVMKILDELIVVDVEEVAKQINHMLNENIKCRVC